MCRRIVIRIFKFVTALDILFVAVCFFFSPQTKANFHSERLLLRIYFCHFKCSVSVSTHIEEMNRLWVTLLILFTPSSQIFIEQYRVSQAAILTASFCRLIYSLRLYSSLHWSVCTRKVRKTSMKCSLGEYGHIKTQDMASSSQFVEWALAASLFSLLCLWDVH